MGDLVTELRMAEVRQSFPPSPKLDFARVLAEQFASLGLSSQVKPGMRIALAVGSRGISNLKELVKATLDLLREAGAKPFLVPAMGSHGGATAEGQLAVLAEYGVTGEAMGVPIEASMAVTKIGTALDGLDVVFSTPALQADGVIVLNRVKPHTDFRGTLGSGLQKMLVIGLGKQVGASNAHGAAAHRGYEVVLRAFAQVVLQAAPIFSAIAVIEDQRHETAAIEVLRPAEIVEGEDRLFHKATSLLARLPFEEIDLLIVDRIGKDISGSGMDTNVIGRDIAGYRCGLHPEGNVTPRIARILVRDLTPASNGNGTGIGMADFTTARLVNALSLPTTYMNALTSLGLAAAKIPIHFANDREAIAAALLSLAQTEVARMRVVRIRDTLHLEQLWVTEGCASVTHGDAKLQYAGPAQALSFDSDGSLVER